MEYEYAKIISYGGTTEIYRYGSRPRGGRYSGKVQSADGMPRLSEDGEDAPTQVKSPPVRTEKNARSAVVAFRRLVASNLRRSDAPLLVTLTYAENQQSLAQARADFNAFAKRAANRFGDAFRYIVVCEFQQRGAIHFHALVWGIPPGVVKQERRTRLVAGLWAKGFVDLRKTDGSVRLAGYLAKYMKKMFLDQRLAGKKAYIASRNITRPVIVKDAIIGAYFTGLVEPDLSTAVLQESREYDTVWLGRCNYQKYLTLDSV